MILLTRNFDCSLHFTVKSEDKSEFRCELCDEVLFGENNLLKHVQNVHEDQNNEPLIK